MIRALARLVLLLPWDRRSRRALDETLLDWDYERADAGTGWRRATVDLAAVAALTRTVTASAMAEVGRTPFGPLLLRLVPLTLAATTLMLLGPISGVWRNLTGTANTAFVLSLLLVPQAIFIALPFTLFLSLTADRRRLTPVVGLASLTLVLSLAIAGWGMPLANQAFREIAYEVKRHEAPGSRYAPPTPGLAELTASDLLPRAAAQPRARTLLLWKVGWALLAGAMVWLGAAVASLSGLRFHLVRIAIPLAALATVIATEWFMRGIGAWVAAAGGLAAASHFDRARGERRVEATN
jgi:hypothetical protein